MERKKEEKKKKLNIPVSKWVNLILEAFQREIIDYFLFEMSRINETFKIKQRTFVINVIQQVEMRKKLVPKCVR